LVIARIANRHRRLLACYFNVAVFGMGIKQNNPKKLLLKEDFLGKKI
jgi:hypothetical protein